jgi:hypothetical protein
MKEVRDTTQTLFFPTPNFCSYNESLSIAVAQLSGELSVFRNGQKTRPIRRPFVRLWRNSDSWKIDFYRFFSFIKNKSPFFISIYSSESGNFWVVVLLSKVGQLDVSRGTDKFGK